MGLVVAVLGLGVSAAVAPAAGGILPASASSGWSLAPDTGFLFAAHVDAVGGQDNAGAITAFEAKLGRKLDGHRVFARWDDPLSSGVVAADVIRGRMPILSIRPQRTDGRILSWESLAAGTHDPAIRAHADAIAALAAPVILTLHHEPDQTAYGSPAEFVAAWRHYVSIFRERGVDNVAWNWIMTPSSFRTPPIGPGADAFYPGDDMVDWISLDPYNWFACTDGTPPAWRPLRQMLTPFVAWADPHGKPLMLAEWASSEDPARATRKAEWFAEAAVTLADFPSVKAVSNYEGIGKCPWWNASSRHAKDAFLDLASSARAHGRASAVLDPDRTVGPEPLAVTFDTSRSTGSRHVTGAGVTSWRLDFGDGSPPANGTGWPPSAWVHTYDAGTYLAQLTVTDASGGRNRDARWVEVAAEPTIAMSEDDLTATSASLHTWVDPQGLAARVTVEWRQGSGYRTAKEFSLPAGGSVRRDVDVTGLDPARSTFWRVRATSAAGTTVSSERSFSTTGKPDVTTEAPSEVRSTSANLHASVSPHSLPTQYFFEWGRTSASDHATARRDVAQGTATWVSSSLTGLAPGTVYRYRAVAENSAGTAYGADQWFTSRL